MYDKEYLRAHIKALRKSKGLSMEKLAEEIDSNKTTIARWEYGERQPTIENLWKMADFFDISIDELVGRK